MGGRSLLEAEPGKKKRSNRQHIDQQRELSAFGPQKRSLVLLYLCQFLGGGEEGWGGKGGRSPDNAGGRRPSVLPRQNPTSVGKNPSGAVGPFPLGIFYGLVEGYLWSGDCYLVGF